MLNKWRITYSVRGQQIFIDVRSNNEFCAREKAHKQLLTQYHHLKLQKDDYRVLSARLIERWNFNHINK